jgi:hypothetical protein
MQAITFRAQVLIWYHRAGNAAEGGGTYFIKSNSLSSMSVNPEKTAATVYSRASIFKVVNGETISIAGNVTLRVDVVDGHDPTSGAGDQVARCSRAGVNSTTPTTGSTTPR